MTHDTVLALSDEDVALAGHAHVLGPAAEATAERGAGDAPAHWIAEAQIQLKELLLLPPNWDSYGAPPIEEEAVARGMRVLQTVGHAPVAIPRPYIGPTSLGGVKLEWDASRLGISIEIEPEHEFVVLIDDYDSGEEWEGPLSALPQELGEYFLLIASG